MNIQKLALCVLFIALGGFILMARAIALSSASPAPQTTQSDEIIDTIHKEVLKRSSTAPTQPKNAGLVGTVASISSTGNLLTITTARQGEKIASLSGQTTIFRLDSSAARKQVKSDDIKVGDNIIAMGQSADNSVITAKRVILYVPDNTVRFVTLGKVTSISSTKVAIENLRDKVSGEFIKLRETDTQQFVQNTAKRDGEIIDIKWSDIKINDLVITAGTKPTNKGAQASLMVKLPAKTP